MRCRDVGDILPELAAGELTDTRSVEARAHIEACPSCKFEFEAYTKALGGLSMPKEMVEVPPALDILRYPEVHRRQWLRPAFATAGVAALLALVLSLIYEGQPLTPNPIMVNTPPGVVHTAPPPDIADVRPPEAPTTARTRIPTTGAAEHPRHVHKRIPIWHAPERREEAPETMAGNPAPPPKTPEHPDRPVAPEVTGKRMVIVASYTPLRPSVEIQSVNHFTGEGSVYRTSEDDSGNEQTIQISYDMNTDDDRRRDL